MVITLCGSAKFKNKFNEVAQSLTKQGHIVISPSWIDGGLSLEDKIRIDNIWLEAIVKSDAIVVINIDQYIGESTFREIDWAERNNKQIIFLERGPETNDQSQDTQNA